MSLPLCGIDLLGGRMAAGSASRGTRCWPSAYKGRPACRALCRSLAIMVQAIENLTTIIGTILSLASHPTLPGYGMLTLRLEETRPAEGKADLISNQLGNEMRVAVRK